MKQLIQIRISNIWRWKVSKILYWCSHSSCRLRPYCLHYFLLDLSRLVFTSRSKMPHHAMLLEHRSLACPNKSCSASVIISDSSASMWTIKSTRTIGSGSSNFWAGIGTWSLYIYCLVVILFYLYLARRLTLTHPHDKGISGKRGRRGKEEGGGINQSTYLPYLLILPIHSTYLPYLFYLSALPTYLSTRQLPSAFVDPHAY